jgi:hypothetical protein
MAEDAREDCGFLSLIFHLRSRALLHVIIRSHEGSKIELVRVTVLIAQEVATTSRCIKAFGRSTIQKPVEPCPDVGRLRISELGQTSLLKYLNQFIVQNFSPIGLMMRSCTWQLGDVDKA